MSAARKFLRFTTRAGIGGGIVYYSYSLGLWKGTDESIANYEKLRKEVLTTYNSAPALVRFVDDKKKFVKEKTVDPVCDSVTSFQKKWLDFDYSWMESEDGVIKPAWNKGVAVTFNFLAHAPETLGIWSVKGWNYVSSFISDSNVASSSTGSSPSKESDH